MNIDVIKEDLHDRGTYTLRVRVLVDSVTSPEFDGDWVTPEQYQLWREDEWGYVGVQVQALFYGAELAEASLWAIPYGGEFGYDVSSTVAEIESWDEFRAEINSRADFISEELKKVSA